MTISNRLTISAVFGLIILASSSGLTRSGSAQSNRQVRIEGEVEIVYEDSHGASRLRHFLVTADKRFEVRFRTQPRETMRTGMRVAVTGVQVGETLELNSGESVSQLSSTLAVSGNPMGQHRVLVILVNFQDKQIQPFTREQAQTVMFETTNNFYREASYGQTWLSGDVYGWYSIPVSSTICDTTAIANFAQQAAASAGANLASYDHLVYAFPQNACTWQGRGSVGGSPSQAWVNEWFGLGIVGHELGHNFGLYHSRSMDCGSLSIGTNCTTDEYGDIMDLMGGANSAHFNLFQKERLAWVNNGSNPPITTVTASGVYWIDPYATASLQPKGLKILKSIDAVTGAKTWYYVEFRIPYGFDNFLSGNQNVLNGVLIRTGADSNGQSTYLLDMTPATTSWYDPALTVGQTFTDAEAGVTITTVSVGPTGAIVDVTVSSQPCVRANPTLTLAPSQSPWKAAGATATFNVSLRNNDSAGCNPASFNWQAAAPTAWVAGFASPTMTIGPGTTGTTTLQVTSPLGTVDGFYAINVNASNGSNPSYGGNAPATYVLVSGLWVTSSAT
ncbi:MAG TPA: hypothetical protein VFT08_03195, partial [Pyrinomonadaceae bacterium]|nr:hypothetical protein [Pyrinomonadaceae bacterium]